MIKLRSFFADKVFLALIALFTVSGLLLLSSASVALSERKFGTIYYFTFRQLFAVLIGLGLFLIIQLIPYNFWKRAALPLMIVSLALLVLVLISPLGVTFGGAKRWLQLGWVLFQPAELVKVSLTLFLAWWFDRTRRASSFLYGFFPVAAMIALVGTLLMLQPDLGTFIIIATTAFVIYFVAGASLRHAALLIGLGLAAFLALTWIAPYRLNRILVFLDPAADPLGIGYQARQAAIAIGSGGFWGTGFGSSFQKQSLLPEPIGDSIFAVIAEEFGFLRVALIVFLFLVFLWKGISIAKAAPDLFSKLAVTGIIASIVAQAFVNIGSISGLLPLAGVPLPFISYGGTSIIAIFVGLGIVYQISKKS